jgi:sec-independent protein translocase protein TatA
MLEGSDLLILAVIVLVLFGGSQLPKLARSLGEAQRELKKAMNDDDKPEDEPSHKTVVVEVDPSANGVAKTTTPQADDSSH